MVKPMNYKNHLYMDGVREGKQQTKYTLEWHQSSIDTIK